MDSPIPPEPPDTAIVMVGAEENETVYIRDDRGLKPDDLHRWYPLLGDDEGDARTWEWLAARDPVRLYRQAELDQAVADGGYEDIGDHRIGRATGICVVHGEWYQIPAELDRLREREGTGRD